MTDTRWAQRHVNDELWEAENRESEQAAMAFRELLEHAELMATK